MFVAIFFVILYRHAELYSLNFFGQQEEHRRFSNLFTPHTCLGKEKNSSLKMSYIYLYVNEKLHQKPTPKSGNLWVTLEKILKSYYYHR